MSTQIIFFFPSGHRWWQRTPVHLNWSNHRSTFPHHPSCGELNWLDSFSRISWDLTNIIFNLLSWRHMLLKLRHMNHRMDLRTFKQSQLISHCTNFLKNRKGAIKLVTKLPYWTEGQLRIEHKTEALDRPNPQPRNLFHFYSCHPVISSSVEHGASDAECCQKFLSINHYSNSNEWKVESLVIPKCFGGCPYNTSKGDLPRAEW